MARYWHAKLRENPDLLNKASGGKTMTCGRYLELWTNHRRGWLGCADEDRRLLLCHVFGDRGLRDKSAIAITQNDLRQVVARLDARVEAGEIQASTATRVWSKVRRLFADMAESKADALRIRSDNPVLGVRGPDKGPDRDKAILYPTRRRSCWPPRRWT